MYFTLRWTPHGGADPAAVRDEILDTVDGMPFENRTEGRLDQFTQRRRR